LLGVAAADDLQAQPTLAEESGSSNWSSTQGRAAAVLHVGGMDADLED